MFECKRRGRGCCCWWSEDDDDDERGRALCVLLLLLGAWWGVCACEFLSSKAKQSKEQNACVWGGEQHNTPTQKAQRHDRDDDEVSDRLL